MKCRDMTQNWSEEMVFAYAEYINKFVFWWQILDVQQKLRSSNWMQASVYITCWHIGKIANPRIFAKFNAMISFYYFVSLISGGGNLWGIMKISKSSQIFKIDIRKISRNYAKHIWHVVSHIIQIDIKIWPTFILLMF